MHPLLAALIALAGNFLLSLGMVFQKRHVGWLGRKVSKGPIFRADRRGWIFGFILMNLAPVFNFLALLGLSPNVVGSMTGACVAFTTILSAKFLKERIGLRKALLTLLLFGSLAVAGLRGEPDGGHFETTWLFVFFLLPLAAGISLFFLRERRKSPRLAVTIAAAAGAAGGFMVLPMRALQIHVGREGLGLFPLLLVILYAVSALFSFALVQLAYKEGEMSSVSPAFYGMQSLWPAIASYGVFGSPFDWIQAIAFLLVVSGILALARGPGKTPAGVV